jgi:hypothetical protein
MSQFFFVGWILFFSASSWAIGQNVGNGGDIIKCTASPSNPFNGNYVLDYVASYDSYSDLIDADPQPLLTIWRNLREKGQHQRTPIFRWLSESLLSFVIQAQGQIFRGTNYAEDNIWILQQFGLVDIDDHQLIQQIPANCMVQTPNGLKPNLTQAVIRQDNGAGKAIYQYDPDVLLDLRTRSNFQFSYLIVHEWLRGSNITDTWRLREAVKLLHTKAFLNASHQDAEIMWNNVSGGGYPIYRLKLKEEIVQIPAKLEDIVPKTFTTPVGIPIKFTFNFGTLESLGCGASAENAHNRNSCAYQQTLYGPTEFWISGMSRFSPYQTKKVLTIIESGEPNFNFSL